MSIFDELKSRGVKKLSFVSIDGLTGLEDGVKSIFPEVVVQRCIVHLVRNSINYTPSKHYKEFCSDLKAVCEAVSLVAAQAAFAELATKWSAYPSAVRVWESNFNRVEQLFDYPSEIRRMIYTTNMIEAFNSALRKVTNWKVAFPNDLSILKILYLRALDIMKKWTMPVQNWALIRGAVGCCNTELGYSLALVIASNI